MTTEGECAGCGRRALLVPLHGREKGGPLRCFICAGQWQAEHGRRRTLGRVVIRTMKAYIAGGGSWKDMDRLVQTALLDSDTFGLAIESSIADPLGNLAETAKTAAETILLTSELLADAVRLTHPDAQPPERRELANRVTQELLALQPFTFPAPNQKPVTPYEPSRETHLTKYRSETLTEPSGSRYPCADCAPTVPLFYCTACRAEWERRCQVERERERPKQREWYARRKARLAMGKRPNSCAACGNEVRGKRKDARFCSAACRQKAHRAGRNG
jgi:hypothetical protein